MIDLVEGINKQDIGLIAIEEIPVGVVLYGYVRGVGGEVISGVSVSLDSQVDVSSSSGQYHFSHVEPGTYGLTANATGYAPYVVEIEVLNQEFNTWDINLAPQGGGALYGQVTDKDTGEGIDGIRVDTDGIVTNTDSNGHYSYSSLAPGTYYMDFTDPQSRYHMVEVDGVSIGGGEKEVNVQMTPTGIVPIPLTPFRGTFADPWSGEKFDTVEALIDNGGGGWKGDPYYMEGWSRVYTNCPYCGQMFDYTWDENTQVGNKREECLIRVFEHINNSHRLICQETGEDFTWSAKSAERYEFFQSECVLPEPWEVTVLPFSAFKTVFAEAGHLSEYVETYQEWFDKSTFEGRRPYYWTPDNVREAAQTYPWLFQATQIMDGPMYGRRGWYEGGDEGANYRWCSRPYHSYEIYHPGSIPTGISLIIPQLEGKNWKCYVDDNGYGWKNLATFEGSGGHIKWSGANQGDIHYGKVMNIRVESGDEMLVILHAYVTGCQNLPHDLSTLERHYNMQRDCLYYCKEALNKAYNRYHMQPRTYAVSEEEQAYVYQGGQCVLGRNDVKISYRGSTQYMYFYCNWNPSDVDSNYALKKTALDAEYAADVAEVNALIAKYAENE